MIAPKTKRITIKDVAKAAGVSVGSASGVLNGAENFSDELRKKIWDAASALNYKPNAQARGLRSGGAQPKRPNSGIIMHVTHMGDENLTISEWEAMRSAILSREAEKMGLYPITYRYHGAKGFQCPPVLNGHVDGAIVGTPHIEVVKALKDRIPMVLMDVPFSLENSDISMVNIDARHGWARLFEFLKKNGHRKIGSISAVNNSDGLLNETNFHNEILAAAKDFGLSIPEGCDLSVRVTTATHEREMRAAAAHFAKRVKAGEITAIVTPVVSYTTSLYTIFKDMGLRVPEDISLAGMHHEIKKPDFGITSVAYDWPALIKSSLETLKNLVSGELESCKKVLVSPGFYPGATVKKITGGAL